MNRNHGPARRMKSHPAYRDVFERLSEALERNSEDFRAQQLNLIGHRLFGDLWRGPEPDEPATLCAAK